MLDGHFNRKAIWRCFCVTGASWEINMNVWVYAVEIFDQGIWHALKTFYCGKSEEKIYRNDETGQTRVVSALPSEEEVKQEAETLVTEFLARGVSKQDIRISKSKFRGGKDIND